MEIALHDLRSTFSLPLEPLSKSTFVRVWSSLCYAFPSLHPDGYESGDSGWPIELTRYAAEAWRRFEISELNDEEMYPSDACWAGLYDRMRTHTVEETVRRFEIAANSGQP